MNETTVKNTLKIALVAGGALVVIPTVYGQGIGIQTLDRMTAGTPQQMERGEEVFDVQCAECHGEQGTGGAPAGERLGAEGFVDTEVERSGLMSIYSVVTHGYEYDDRVHPVFENLRYQDRWAVAHYTHQLIDDPQPDPDDVVARIRREAREGICDPAVREEVSDFAEPLDDEQIARGEEEFMARCATCHGDDGRADVPAAQTDPPARDFHQPADEWTRGTSPFALFETLDVGVEGTAMAPFGHLPDDDLWAMVHFMREELIPPEELEEVTEAQIDAVCRSLSAPEPPDPIPVERAVEFLAEDAEDERMRRLLGYGDPVIVEQLDGDEAANPSVDTEYGGQLFEQNCAGCHGEQGTAPEPIGPYGKFPPYLTLTPSELVPASAGGTYEDFAQRVLEDAHFSLPDRPSVSHLSSADWRDLQAWMVEEFDGLGAERVQYVGDIDEALELLDDAPVDETDEEEVDEEEVDDDELDDEESDDEPEEEQLDDEPAEEPAGEPADDQQLPEETETEQADEE